MEEIWKPVLGAEGTHEVSNLGNVRRLPHRNKINSLGRTYHIVGHPITQTVSRTGYRFITIRGNGPRLTKLTHRAVLEAFVGTRPPGFVCRHLNGDKLDNRLCNLTWGTQQENVDDMARHGTTARGARSGMSKINDDIARDIISSHKSQRSIAREYGLSQGTVWAIKKRITWKHVQVPT